VKLAFRQVVTKLPKCCFQGVTIARFTEDKPAYRYQSRRGRNFTWII
jgi:hypothetical protein